MALQRGLGKPFSLRFVWLMLSTAVPQIEAGLKYKLGIRYKPGAQ